MKENCKNLDVTNKAQYIYKRYLDVKKKKEERNNEEDDDFYF